MASITPDLKRIEESHTSVQTDRNRKRRDQCGFERNGERLVAPRGLLSLPLEAAAAGSPRPAPATAGACPTRLQRRRGLAPPIWLRRPPTKPNHRPCLLQFLHHHLSHGRLDQAVDALPSLALRGLRPDTTTIAHLLRGCLIAGALPLARRVHLYLHATGLKRSYPSRTFLSNHLLSFHFQRGRPTDARRLFEKMPGRNLFSYNAMLAGYARLGQLDPARRLFDRMTERDVISWNTMIIALARVGSPKEAVDRYTDLRRSSIAFNPYTFSGLLIACSRLGDLHLARQVHAQILLVGFTSNLIISSSLVDAYAKCRCMDEARKMFDEMSVRDVMAWTTLVNGYAKCGDLVAARELFDVMPEKNTISWTALIGGYARSGLSVDALDLFRRMTGSNTRPDQFTFSSSLCACTAIASLKHGKQIHARLFRTHFHPNAVVLSSLIDMYSKCGDLGGGQRVFDHTATNKRDVVMWNTMISAIGQHGHGIVAIQMFEDMVKTGAKPDVNTFVVLLTACSHSGLVSEGLQFFRSMTGKYGIVPEEEHYVCLVDLLGRAGHFEEAIGWLRNIPCQSSVQAWNVLLGACRIHGDLQLASEAAKQLIDSEPQSSAVYVLLSNIYAEVGRWESVEKVRYLMEEQKVRKERAASWININNTIHSFGASDKLHPLKEETHATLDMLLTQINDGSLVT